ERPEQSLQDVPVDRASKKRSRGRKTSKAPKQRSFEETSKKDKQKSSLEKEEKTAVLHTNQASTRTSINTVDEPSKHFSRAAKRAQVKVFVEQTLKKGVQGLIAEFKAMKRVNDFTKMTEFVAQIPEGRNRYKDVGCLDNDRVILKIGPVSYIHANYVSTPVNPKRFICTQAPLPKTCPDFWYMVVQEKSVAILMLCNFVEQNAKKCAEYFPTEEGTPLEFEDVVVTLKKQEQFPFPFETKVKIMVRQLEVSVPGQPVHSCFHYHWMDWPDRGVPEADLAPIALLARLKENTAPIIVHCSAGIGRTGSIVLIEHAMELLHQPSPLLEIKDYLVELRKQRNNSIQTEHQYLYIHQVLLLYLKKTKYLDDSVTPYLDVFTKDYVAATRGF
ncbi:Receptor-type tyrosine-protein phosphatase C, partial [Trichostrongylus colubriformis]